MPLEHGDNPETIAHNVKEMVKSGHPQRQAVAAALHEAKDSLKRMEDTVSNKRNDAEPYREWASELAHDKDSFDDAVARMSDAITGDVRSANDPKKQHEIYGR